MCLEPSRISYVAKSLSKQQENTSNRKYFGSCTTKFIFTCVCVCVTCRHHCLQRGFTEKKYYYSIFFRYHQHRNAKIYSDVITYIPNLFPCCVSCCGATYEEDDPGFHVKHLDKTRPFFVTFLLHFEFIISTKLFLESESCWLRVTSTSCSIMNTKTADIFSGFHVTRYDKPKTGNCIHFFS